MLGDMIHAFKIFKVVALSRVYALTAAAAKSLQLCLTLCDPIDSSLPGSPIPGVRGMTPEQTLEGEVGLARQKKQ